MPLSGSAAAVAAADDFLTGHLGSLLARQPSSTSSGSGSQSGAPAAALASPRRSGSTSSVAAAEPCRSGSSSSTAAASQASGSGSHLAAPRTRSHTAASPRRDSAPMPSASHARSSSSSGDASVGTASSRRPSAPSAGFTTRFGSTADLRRGSRGGPGSSGSGASSSSHTSTSPTAATSRRTSTECSNDAWGAPSLFGFSLGSSEPLIADDAVPHTLPEAPPCAPPGLGSHSVPSAQVQPRYTSMISSRRPSDRRAGSSVHALSRPASTVSSRRSQAGSRASSPDAATSERASGGLEAVREAAEELAARREADLLPPAPDCAEPTKDLSAACAQARLASEMVLVPFGTDGRSFRFVERASLSQPTDDLPAPKAAPAAPAPMPLRRPAMPHAASRTTSVGSTGSTAFSLPSPGSLSPFSSSPSSECPPLSPSAPGRNSPDDSGPDTPEDGVALRPTSKEEQRRVERDPLDRQAKRVVNEGRHRLSPEIAV